MLQPQPIPALCCPGQDGSRDGQPAVGENGLRELPTLAQQWHLVDAHTASQGSSTALGLSPTHSEHLASGSYHTSSSGELPAFFPGRPVWQHLQLPDARLACFPQHPGHGVFCSKSTHTSQRLQFLSVPSALRAPTASRARARPLHLAGSPVIPHLVLFFSAEPYSQ